MCSQIACVRGCIVALVAFVWFSPNVGFQMCFYFVQIDIFRILIHLSYWGKGGNWYKNHQCLQGTDHFIFFWREINIKIRKVKFIPVSRKLSQSLIWTSTWLKCHIFINECIHILFIEYKWAIISKTSVTDAVFAEKTIPQMRFLQVLTLWTCFPCMFDMSTMLKLCWNCFRAFWAVSCGRFLKLLPKVILKRFWKHWEWE